MGTIPMFLWNREQTGCCKAQEKTECTLFMIHHTRLALDPNTIKANTGTVIR